MHMTLLNLPYQTLEALTLSPVAAHAAFLKALTPVAATLDGPVLIYGGGSSGAAVLSFLQSGLGVEVVGVVDQGQPCRAFRGLPHYHPGELDQVDPRVSTVFLATAPRHHPAVLSGPLSKADCAERVVLVYAQERQAQAAQGPGESLPDAADMAGRDFYEHYNQYLRDYYATSTPAGVDMVMLGDSITFSSFDWKELLEHPGVCNRAMNGETVHGLLSRMDQVLALGPRRASVMIGINDLLKGFGPAACHAGQKKLLERLAAEGVRTCVLAVLYVGNNSGLVGDFRAVNEQVRQVNLDLADLARELGMHFIDLNPVLAPRGILLPGYTYNGLHLNIRANLVWAKALKEWMAAG